MAGSASRARQGAEGTENQKPRFEHPARQCPKINLLRREVFNLLAALSEETPGARLSPVWKLSLAYLTVLCPTPAGWARSSIGIKEFFLV